MTKRTITTRTSDQIAAAFDAVFKDIKPPTKAKRVSIADVLEPYCKAIMKRRARGNTWEQIAAGRADARIGEKVTARALRKVFATPVSRPAPAPTPARERLFLDPATGLRIQPPPRPGAAPTPSS